MSILELVNSRLVESCLDQVDDAFRAELAKVEVEIAQGLWTVTDVGISIGCSEDPVMNRRMGCKIVEATPPMTWPVLKDTIVQRMKAVGLLSNLAGMVETLSKEDRFEFDNSSWFASNNPRIAAGISECGGDPIVILAFDPLA
jgi:hypothetical protein